MLQTCLLSYHVLSEGFPFDSCDNGSLNSVSQLLVEILMDLDSYPLQRSLIKSLEKISSLPSSSSIVKKSFSASISKFFSRIPESPLDHDIRTLETLIQHVPTGWYEKPLGDYTVEIMRFFLTKLKRLDVIASSIPFNQRQELYGEVLGSMCVALSKLPFLEMFESEV